MTAANYTVIWNKHFFSPIVFYTFFMVAAGKVKSLSYEIPFILPGFVVMPYYIDITFYL